ncbi:hypothetical protein BZG02_06960 [Labilibaculum filiforme]|uniref:Uncharacterized protein n=2 Tax=Labilibaculum filiforme TaxID=1940526 RepID=A0A2N3I0D6_9BACT|nr:hypothetical protein BZG02_06960 [Labilibaculum filiforme]
MIVVKQENKHALVADLLPETDEAASEYHDSEASDLDLFSINRIKFFAFKANTYSKLSFNLSSCDKGKLESPPPQS